MIQVQNWLTTRQFYAALLQDIDLHRYVKRNRKFPGTSKGQHQHYAMQTELNARRHLLRHRHLAIGFMRGHLYKQCENKALIKPDAKLIALLIPYDWFSKNMVGKGKKEDVVAAWLESPDANRWPAPLKYRIWTDPKPVPTLPKNEVVSGTSI